MLGLPGYLDLFPEEGRDRVFSVLGPHPTLSELLAVLRIEGVSVGRMASTAIEPCGESAVLRTASSSRFVDVAVYNAEVHFHDPTYWFTQHTFVVWDARCSFRDIPTHRDEGYCYLGLYPRTQWYHLGAKLGAWPTASMLPPGRYPAAVPSLAVSALVGLCHVERLIPGAVDQLAALPSQVRVGGSLGPIWFSEPEVAVLNDRQNRMRPTRERLRSDVERVTADQDRADHFYFGDVVEPDACPHPFVATESCQVALVGRFRADQLEVSGDMWVIYVPPGCSVARAGVVLTAVDGRYLYVHGAGPAVFEWSGFQRWCLIRGETSEMRMQRLALIDGLCATSYGKLPACGTFIAARVQRSDPGESASVFPRKDLPVQEFPLVTPKACVRRTQFVQGKAQWYAKFTCAGVYVEPDGVVVFHPQVSVLSGVRVRFTSPALHPGEATWLRFTTLPGVHSDHAHPHAALKRVMAPVVMARRSFPDVSGDKGVTVSWFSQENQSLV
jgi:hypothetical protein